MLSLITRTLKFLCATALTVLLLMVIIVIIDTKLQLGAVWASEFSVFLLGWVVLLGGALAYAEKSHLGLDILVEKLDHSLQRKAHITGHCIIIIFSAGVMVYGGYNTVVGRWEMGQTIPSLNISQSWFYLSLPVAGVLILLTAIAHLFEKPLPESTSA